MQIEQLFLERKKNPILNTSYPISPIDWNTYKRKEELDFSDDDKISFYIHIPFCQHLCDFCEYVRTSIPNSDIQSLYLKGIKKDIDQFLEKYPFRQLCGFDIGGGTPTALNDKNFEFLMNIYGDAISKMTLTSDFEPSIESTFQTIDLEKSKMICNSGFRRVSFGIQSSVKIVQQSNNRVNPDMDQMLNVFDMLHHVGISKINIDLMYGLRQQNVADIQIDIDTIKRLDPEQVTLYELRTNMLSHVYDNSKDMLFQYYSALYEGLISLGYKSRFGQNTFSKNQSDLGLSSYLRNRMLQFNAYRGFGISAQSMSKYGVSYNVGKNDLHIKNLLDLKSFPAKDTYVLPSDELLSKYIAISAYYGQFSIKVADRILGQSFRSLYSQEINFCLSKGYLESDANLLTITREGFKYYGAIFSLFFSK